MTEDDKIVSLYPDMMYPEREVAMQNHQAAESEEPEINLPFRAFCDFHSAWKALQAIPAPELERLVLDEGGREKSVTDYMEQFIHELVWKRRDLEGARLARIRTKKEVKGDVTRI